MKYEHTASVHNFSAALEIVPELIKLCQPASVVDVGCGIGTWLKVFMDYGVETVLGIDGDYLDKGQLVIDESLFLPKDLEQPLQLDQKFDMVISLEVAEHLHFDSANVFIDSLCDLGNFVVFSAAIHNQGGQNHINEQAPDYWTQKFEDRGYKMFDVLRPLFWNNEKVNWWYKQNIMIFCCNDALLKNQGSYSSFGGQHLVHPILFHNRTNERDMYSNELDKIERADKLVSYYFNLFKEALIKKMRR